MASAELSRRVEKVVSYPPLSELGDLQRRVDPRLALRGWTRRSDLGWLAGT
jgi:hypothetical protein